MDSKLITQKYAAICKFAANKQLKKAINILRELAEQTPLQEHCTSLEHENETYKFLLQYTIDGVNDPQRNDIYNRIVKSVLELADKVHEYLREHSTHIIPEYKSLKAKAIQVKEQDYNQAMNFFANSKMLDESNKIEYEKCRENIFIHFWFTNKYTDTQLEFCRTVNKNVDITMVDKSILVSAITLSLLRYFDIQKLSLLLDFVEQNEHEVKQRALTGLVLSMHKYDQRLKFYKGLYARIETSEYYDAFQNAVKDISIQLIKALDTEQIQTKIRTEILSKVSKFTPKIIKKLDLDNIIGENLFDEDKNPDWENIFSDSPDLLEKMGQLSQMQLEGTDVFMGTFSQLKNFSFFDKQHNWFIPFYADNEDLINLLESEEFNGKNLVNTMANVPFICNSDKYSFCLNINSMHSSQRNMLSKMFFSELKDIEEIGDDDKLLKKGSKDRFVFTQYIQDLYRFFKLNKLSNIYSNIFSKELNLYTDDFYQNLITKKEITNEIAAFYFEKNHYTQALHAYMSIKEHGITNYETFQKIAFCHQKLKDYENALEFYLKAELFDKNKTWNLKKIAFCYLKLEQADNALEYYKQAEVHEPENLKIQANIGRCHVALGNYEEALKYYFKVEYLAPKNNKVQRPISWCSLQLGKFDVAKKYLNKIGDETLPEDFLNLGHTELCTGNLKSASEFYTKAAQKFGNFKTFLTEFNNDIEILEKHKVNKEELHLLLDFIKYQIESML